MDTAIVLRLPHEQYEQLTEIARSRRIPIDDIAKVMVSEWLDQQARFARACMLMRDLGKGLARGAAPHNVALNHDKFLYSRKHA